MVAAGTASCTLTRSLSLHATHQYTGGGPAEPHGHLYRFEITVAGQVGPDQSALIDLGTLDAILTQEVTDPLSGRDLNAAVGDVAGGTRQPTCEAVAIWCWQRIAPRLPTSVRLARVKVGEDDTLWAECTGID